MTSCDIERWLTCWRRDNRTQSAHISRRSYLAVRSSWHRRCPANLTSWESRFVIENFEFHHLQSLTDTMEWDITDNAYQSDWEGEGNIVLRNGWTDIIQMQEKYSIMRWWFIILFYCSKLLTVSIIVDSSLQLSSLKFDIENITYSSLWFARNWVDIVQSLLSQQQYTLLQQLVTQLY